MTLRRTSLLLISVTLICMCVVTYFERSIVAGRLYGETDFFRLYTSVLFYFSGQDIYSSYIVKNRLVYYSAMGNLNAPFIMLLSLPFHVLNYARAFVVWTFISITCLLFGGYLALKPFPQEWKNRLPILMLFLLYFPNLLSLKYGEFSAVLLVIVTLAWLFARENKDNAAGFFIGLACAFKLFCGLFLIYFLCLKRFRVFSVSLLTLLGTFFLGGWVFGFASYRSYFTSLKKIGWYADSWNVSFHGFFARFFSGAEGNVPLIAAPHMASLLTLACSGILLLYLIGVWRKQGHQEFDRGFSLVLVSMLLLSPLAWIYYFPLLIIPYFVIVSQKNDWAHFAACLLLLFSTKIPALLYSPEIKSASQVLWDGGVGFYVLLGLLILLVKPYPEYRRFAPGLWGVIYTLIFFPAIFIMVVNFCSFTFGHRI